MDVWHGFVQVEPRIVGSDAMFKSAQAQNMFMCWLVRIVGTILIFTAFNMLFAPLSVILEVRVAAA